ncbi:prenyltransferase/squalene oxidase repeat-containing protein [Terriglobus sp. 2YAB30_2]|uniref:prenyltransferase/squalene oxidase repeat-containing protein n=1 Tax=unclassified Terriglobus TaxID=2628988 RepID=UPI003F9AF205
MSGSKNSSIVAGPFLAAEGCLQFLWPVLSGFHLDEQTRESIHHAARQLAPIPRLALELRLNAGAQTPDLHQMVQPYGDDDDALTWFLQSRPSLQYPPRLREFVASGESDDSQAKPTRAIFFEWDFDRLHQPASVFLPVDAKFPALPALSLHDLRMRQLRALTTTGQISETAAASQEAPPWAPAMQDNVSVSHIGSMPSRGDLLRVNYRNVRQSKLGLLLQEIAWPGETQPAFELFDELVEIADTITVAINFIHRRPTKDIGFEIMFDEQPSSEPRWQQLFMLLGKLGICSEVEAACLLKVDGRLYPYMPKQTWPLSWLLATELRSGDAVPYVERALSHLKVTLSAEGKMMAKAYVSAQHCWSDTPPADPVAISTSHAPCLSATVSAAIKFLLSRQHQSGWWTEFRTNLGPSDEWATAFVGYALGCIDDADARRGAEDAVNKLLRRQRAGGGWGWNGCLPPDADSTAWAVHLFRRMGYEGMALVRAMQFISAHLLQYGGISTYQAGVSVEYRGHAAKENDDGWQSEHLCTAANVAPLLGRLPMRRLCETQNDDGSWTAYWWQCPALSTALAAEALASVTEYRASVDRAILWAWSYRPSAPSAWIDAWIIRILRLGNASDQQEAHRRAEALACRQLEDGSWPSGTDIVSTDTDDRSGATARHLEEPYRIFTTAAVLMALTALGVQPTTAEDTQP